MKTQGASASAGDDSTLCSTRKATHFSMRACTRLASPTVRAADAVLALALCVLLARQLPVAAAEAPALEPALALPFAAHWETGPSGIAAGTGRSGSESGPLGGIHDARLHGAKGDAATDDTQAIQAALDAASLQGGRVWLAPGRYLVAGSLRIPPGVQLEGALEFPQWTEPLRGTVLLAMGGRDKEDGPALFELGHSSAVRALSVYYPEQKVTEIHPYAWTFHLQGHDNTVENVTLINSFNGIRVGPESNVRHRIRSVSGCVLRRGISIDSTTDIGRIENVQFHCHWWSSKEVGGDWKPVFDYMTANCEAFIFGRTDWEYVTNTFVFPVSVGYRFIATKSGSANGQFSGIGADAAQRCIVVEAIQNMGLLITNGQFVAFAGKDPIEVVVEKTCTGSVRFTNCAFWGPATQNVVVHGGLVSLANSYLSSDLAGNERPLVEADGGKLQVRGCTFGIGRRHVALREGLAHAIVTENNGADGVDIANDIGEKAIVRDNEVRAP